MRASIPRILAAVALTAAIPLVFPAALAGQSASAAIKYGEPTRLPLAEEIALARSAAPEAVSADATVLVLEDGAKQWITAVEGTNGAACWVSRSWEQSLEPHCFDPEGAETILPIHVAKAEMSFAGATKEEVDRAIAEGVAEGRFRYPSRPAMSYMLSAGQVLVNDDGSTIGAWKPHLMVYWPGLSRADIGAVGTGQSIDSQVILVDEGTDDACLVVVVPEFVEPAALASTE